jgi:hypothetical protein
LQVHNGMALFDNSETFLDHKAMHLVKLYSKMSDFKEDYWESKVSNDLVSSDSSGDLNDSFFDSASSSVSSDSDTEIEAGESIKAFLKS